MSPMAVFMSWGGEAQLFIVSNYADVSDLLERGYTIPRLVTHYDEATHKVYIDRFINEH